jgi:RNA polymerase sigma-70 factor (ECF subfamily)
MAESHGRRAQNHERHDGVASETLQRLYVAVHPALLRYLRVLAGQSAEDVASQVWLEIALIPELPTADEEVRRLAFVIARRRASDLRRRWWHRKVDVRPPGSAELDRSTAAPEHPDDSTVALLRLLPRGQAEVVLLRVLGGFSAEEVAEMTGMTPGHVRVLQHRALNSLRRTLQPRPGEEL